MFLRKSAKGYYSLFEMRDGKEVYIKSLGKDPTRFKEMKEEADNTIAILERNPILVEELGAAKKRLESAERNLRLKTQLLPPIPEGDIYYADPPWQYDFSETITREIENQYPTMELGEIKKLAIPSPQDSALFLWATAPKLIEALEVMKAWGFTYKTNMIWDKEKFGMGYWFRGQHELLLVGTKGNMSPPDSNNRISSVFKEKRGEHSAKPLSIHDIIEAMLPNLTYVELFARKPYNEKWLCWGNEII